ncbi:class I adenylate-forming enzyme family protein [Streptacidiphilus jiangxiensis]|uniref:Long-chain acyl-CoA synthetase n=1 Tax=Streptacidiphilus jiangxiensis TaxID=235985 RepID=A0A1H7XAU0_STRJI|nr:AMP-binding protein [Streptacidiphilus jiangxiensis]SEM30831.1 long-chain acyl-CoA synthetase [Streptacidiphilus jiangxiensis]
MNRALWPVGLPRTLDYPRTGLHTLLASAARAYGARDAIVDGEQRLTFSELYENALRFAQGLRERGIGPGDVVALVQPNSLWYPVGYHGTLLAGATVSAVNPTQPTDSLAAALDEVGARALITHPAVLPALRPLLEERPSLLAVLVPPTATAPGPDDEGADPRTVPLADLLDAAPAPATPRSPDDLAHLAFTGGTTGRSKAVRVRDRHLWANVLQGLCARSAVLPEYDAEGMVTLRRVPEAVTPWTSAPGEDVVVNVVPLFHAMGLVSHNIGLLGGTTVVGHGRFDPREFLAAMVRHGATGLTGSPAMHHALLAATDVGSYDLRAVRLVNSGAAPLDSPTIARMAAAYPNAAVAEGYGLTEATMALTFVTPDRDHPAPPGCVGVPLFDTELQIRDLADPAKPLPVGETGLVFARGPQVNDGYLDRPELTAEQWVDGWLATGDIGRLDEDGRLFLSGRAKDMLIYKGYNVYPTQLEEVLAAHPAVAQVAVIGAPHPEAGEIPAAYVVARPGAEVGADELLEFVAARVAPYQRVREVHFLPGLPVSAAGKILKTELRALYARRSGESGAAADGV